MFARILAPFDGSKNAEAALHKAVALQKLCGAELFLLTVFRHHSYLEASFSMVRPGDPGNLDEVMQGHAKEVVEHGKRIAADAGSPNVRGFVRNGPVARSIVAFAAEHAIDLIVIGSRGLGSIEGYLMGSVSHKVTSTAECPVLVV